MPAPKYIQLLSREGDPIQDMPKVFNAFHQQFSKTSGVPTTSPSYPQMEARAWYTITSQEILDALGPTSVKSAPRPDKLGWAILKH